MYPLRMMGAIYCAPTPILPNLVMGVLYHGPCVLARQYVVWLFDWYYVAGLLGLPVLPQKLATQQLQGFHGMGAKMAHLGSHIGHMEPIHQREDASIEGSQRFRG